MTNPYPAVPDGHPFKKFLWGLAEEPECSPRPDILEQATSSRYFMAFCGVNASARLRRFRTLFDLERPSASIMTSKIGKEDASITLFLNNAAKYMGQLSDDGKVVQFTLLSDDVLGPRVNHNPPFVPYDDDGSHWEAVNAKPTPKPEEIPGIKHMPTYS